MSAPKNNKFWQLRSKHGREKLFANPNLMWKSACEYFKWCDDNPLKESVLHQKTCKIVEVPKMRPYTMQGLCIYLGCSTGYFRNFKKNLNIENEPDQDFLTVITRIEEIIYQQKFEGASAGLFNANIISRDLGLADKKIEEKEPDHVKIVIHGVSSETEI